MVRSIVSVSLASQKRIFPSLCGVSLNNSPLSRVDGQVGRAGRPQQNRQAGEVCAPTAQRRMIIRPPSGLFPPDSAHHGAVLTTPPPGLHSMQGGGRVAQLGSGQRFPCWCIPSVYWITAMAGSTTVTRRNWAEPPGQDLPQSAPPQAARLAPRLKPVSVDPGVPRQLDKQHDAVMTRSFRSA
jgi:hypothetical protein